LLAGLTFWLERATQEGTGGRSKARHDADYYVERFTFRRYDADGKLQHTLSAQQLVHFPDDESTEVTAPRLTYFRDRISTATANRAWLDKEGKHVRLNDDVRVVRAGDVGDPETVMTTTVLNVVPDDEYAYTDAPVRIAHGRSVFTGTGFESSGKTKISVLSGPAHGLIERGAP
jgi:lipopolysaccharide export system protein LptC